MDFADVTDRVYRAKSVICGDALSSTTDSGPAAAVVSLPRLRKR